MVAELIAILPLSRLAWVDARSHRIPDDVILFLLLCGLYKIYLGGIQFSDAIFGLVTVGLPVFCFAIFLEKYAVMGGGDIKLCAALGFLFGYAVGYTTILLAIIFMSLTGLIFRRKAMPFAPFVLPAYCITIFLRSV